MNKILKIGLEALFIAGLAGTGCYQSRSNPVTIEGESQLKEVYRPLVQKKQDLIYVFGGTTIGASAVALYERAIKRKKAQ